MYKSFKDINENAVLYVEKIQNGIEPNENFNLLLNEFKPIIKKVVSSVKHNGYIENDDLEQEAIITLWKCCSKYDFNSKAAFYTYFYGCAFNSLSEYVYKYQTPVTMNKHEKERTKMLREFAKAYYEENGRYPTVDEYVDFGFSRRLSKRFADYVLNMNCADCGLEEVEICENDNLTVEEICEKNERNKRLYNAIRELDDKYKSVIVMRYFENRTEKEIADEMEIHERTVRKRLTKAIEMLKNSLGDYE